MSDNELVNRVGVLEGNLSRAMTENEHLRQRVAALEQSVRSGMGVNATMNNPSIADNMRAAGAPSMPPRPPGAFGTIG